MIEIDPDDPTWPEHVRIKARAALKALEPKPKPTTDPDTPKPKRRTPEADLQKTITDHADQLGIPWNHTRPTKHNDNWQTPTTGTPGWPDLTLTKNGRHALLELKTPGNKPTPTQQACLHATGGYWTDNHADAIPLLNYLAGKNPNPPTCNPNTRKLT